MKFPLPLRITIPASLFLFGLFLGALSFFYEVRSSFHRIEEDIHRRAAFLGNQVSGALQFHFSKEDMEAANLQISYVGANPNLRLTAVCDQNGRIVLSTRYEIKNQLLEQTSLAAAKDSIALARKTMSAQFILAPDGNRFFAVFPFLLPPENGALRSSQSAVLYLEYDLTLLKSAELADAIKRSAVIGGVLAVLSLGIWFFFDLILTRRALKLQRVTQRLAAGHLDTRANLKGSDELAKVASALDQMADSIRSRTLLLEEANKKMKHEIAERESAENRFLSVWKSSADGMRLTDAHGNIVAVNEAFCRLVGMNADELEGKPFTVCYGTAAISGCATTAEMLEKYQQRFANRHVDVIIDRSVTFKSGKTAGIEVTSSFIAQDNDELMLLCIFRDVTERKKTEELLQQQVASMKASMDGMAILDQNGIYIFLNEAHAKINGYNSSSELLGQSWEILYERDELCRFQEHIMPSMFKTGHWRGEAVGRKRDGTKFPQEVSISRIDNGGMVCVVRDITRRKAEEERRLAIDRKLLDAQKLESLGILAGGIAHDFNNLLTAILGNANLALMQCSDVAPQRPYLTNIEKTSMQAADLCKQMLAYSGRGKFVIQRLDLSAVVNDMMHLLQISVHKRVSLKFHLPENLSAIEADPSQVRQIVMNLVINASEAIGEKDGVVSISTGMMRADHSYLTETYLAPDLPEGDYIFLEVSDTGCGMTLETRGKIFEPFFTTKFTGRGLGLAAVLGIVRGHKGAIKVYSEVGRGTSFKVLIPCVDAPAEALNHQPAEISEWKGSGTILVVDDEETVRTVTARMLELFGFEVILAEDGRIGVEKFSQHAKELRAVILDMTMPHLNGDEAFREMRRIRSDIRVLLVSGYSEQEATNRFTGKGLAGFLQKPYKLEDLRKKIRDILEA